MAKVTGYFMSAEFCAALRAMGIEPNDARRIVIDIQSGNLPVIYVEYFADNRMIELAKLMAGSADVRVDRASDYVRIDKQRK